jgi:hypothetical protein
VWCSGSVAEATDSLYAIDARTSTMLEVNKNADHQRRRVRALPHCVA